MPLTNQEILLIPLEVLDRVAQMFLLREDQLELWPRALRVERVLEDIRFCVQEAMAHISSAEFTKERAFLLMATNDQLKVNLERIFEAMEGVSFPLKVMLDRGGYGFNYSITMMKAFNHFQGAMELHFLELDCAQDMQEEEKTGIYRQFQLHKKISQLPPNLRKLLEDGGESEE